MGNYSGSKLYKVHTLNPLISADRLISPNTLNECDTVYPEITYEQIANKKYAQEIICMWHRCSIDSSHKEKQYYIYELLRIGTPLIKSELKNEFDEYTVDILPERNIYYKLARRYSRELLKKRTWK